MTTNTTTGIDDRFSLTAVSFDRCFDLADQLIDLGDDGDIDLVEELNDRLIRFLGENAPLLGRINQRASVLMDREADRLIRAAVRRGGAVAFNVRNRDELANRIMRLTGDEGYKPDSTLTGIIMDRLFDLYGIPLDDTGTIFVRDESNVLQFKVPANANRTGEQGGAA